MIFTTNLQDYYLKNLKSQLSTTLHVSDILLPTAGKSSKNEQKQPSRGVLRRMCSENMHQIYRITPMSKSEFNKVAKHFTLRDGCSPVNLLHISQEILWTVASQLNQFSTFSIIFILSLEKLFVAANYWPGKNKLVILGKHCLPLA